jgi:hypothetical protein
MKEWIENHLMTNGKFISRRLNETWFVSNGFRKEYNILTQNHLKLIDSCKINLGLQRKCKCCDIGFEYVGISKPSYKWVKDKETLSRFETQMVNEDFIMRQRGYLKVYDSGNEIFNLI